MAPFRNFLTRKSAPNGGETDNNLSIEGQRSNPQIIRTSGENPPNEFKLSVVDDNGEYLPPSPPEKQSFWRKLPGSPRPSNHRNMVDENEPFSISRESFDSYRRSFDISARSQISYTDAMPSRTSLDSRFSHLSSSHANGIKKQDTMEEDQFEDVGLDDEEAKPRKKGLFARFSDFSTDSQPSNSKSSLGFHIPGRKRGESGGGSEMSAMSREDRT